MRIRDVYLLNGSSLNDSDTVTINLPRTWKILSIRIQYQDKNGATSNTLCRLNGLVSKIAVIDGSDVLHSLSMREEQALNAFTYGRLPFQLLSEDDDIVVIEECIIDFRRHLGDTQFFLDTSKYANPQLQLTHALTVSATAGFVTGQGTLTVIARIIDSGAPSQLGFVLSKEVDSFSSTSSGDHRTILPNDFPIGKVLVINPVDGNTADNYISNFKLTADIDTYVPVNISIGDILRENMNRYGEFWQRIDALPDTSATLTGDLYYRTRAWTAPEGATSLGVITAITANQATLAMTTGGSGPIGTVIQGQAPHAGFIYNFGDGYSPDQIWSPQGVGKFEAVITGANTGATVKVVTVQQHP